MVFLDQQIRNGQGFVGGIPPSLLADIFVHLFCGGFGKAVVQSLYKEMFVRVAFISLFGLFTDGGGEKSYDVGRA